MTNCATTSAFVGTTLRPAPAGLPRREHDPHIGTWRGRMISGRAFAWERTMPRGRKLLPIQIERSRLDYTDPERSVEETADAAGVATSTVRALAKRCGWVRRRTFDDAAGGGPAPTGPGQVLAGQVAILE